MGVDGLIAAERNGDGYAVLGNVVLNARGRGLALGAAGLARGNTIAHPKYWGIQVRPRSGDAGPALQHIDAVAILGACGTSGMLSCTFRQRVHAQQLIC